MYTYVHITYHVRFPKMGMNIPPGERCRQRLGCSGEVVAAGGLRDAGWGGGEHPHGAWETTEMAPFFFGLVSVVFFVISQR